MKNKILIAATLAFTAFISCSDDDLTGLAPNAKTTASTTVSSLTVIEGDTGVIPFTIANPSNKAAQFKIQVVSGTATEDIDYTAGDQDMDADTGLQGEGFEITVPAYATSFDIPVNAIWDIDAEGSETVKLKISASGVRTVLIENESVEVDVTITNIETTDFLWRMEWDQTFIGTDGEEHTFCDSFNVDLDLEIYDAGFGGPSHTSYGNCPEEILLSVGDLPDGDYWLVPSFWDLTSTVPAGLEIPVTFTFAKPGVWVEQVTTDIWNTTDGGAQSGNPDAYLVKFQLNINGSIYTLTDADTGDVIVSGKTAQFVPGARARKN